MKPLNSLLLWVKFTSLIRIGFHADQWRGMTYFSPFDPLDQSNAWDRIPIYNSRLSKQFFNFFYLYSSLFPSDTLTHTLSLSKFHNSSISLHCNGDSRGDFWRGWRMCKIDFWSSSHYGFGAKEAQDNQERVLSETLGGWVSFVN